VRAYQFRLAAVARIRALEERVAADRFMVAQRDLRRAQEMVRLADAALGGLEAPSGVITTSELAWTHDQAGRLAEAARARRHNMAAAELACVQARSEWSTATRRSGVLERLHAQGLARWRDEAMRQEAAELDDLSHARHGLAGAPR
jgi:flagellar export protein FliJ